MPRSPAHGDNLEILDDLQVPEYHELQLLRHDSTAQLPQRDFTTDAPERDTTTDAPERDTVEDAPEWNVSRDLPEPSGVREAVRLPSSQIC